MSKALAEFRSYLENVYPGPALHPDQVLQLERAFMAGSVSMFNRLDELAHVPVMQAMSGLVEARKECADYCAAVSDEPARILAPLPKFYHASATRGPGKN